MKILGTLNNISNYDTIANLTDGIVLSNCFLSAYCERSFSNLEIKEVLKKAKKTEVYLLVNRMFFEEDLRKVKKFINEFKDTNLFYIFADIAVFKILEEFGIERKGVYNPTTLITNYLDFRFWKTLKIKGLFASNEIPLKDVKIIADNKDSKLRKLYLQAFGYVPIYQSRRHILKTYCDYKKIDYKSANYDLMEETRDKKNKVIDNDFGSFIFNSGIRNTLDGLDIISDCVDYIFLDGRFIPEDKYIMALTLYKEALCDIDHLNLYNDSLNKIFDNLSSDFIYNDSIFRKEEF